MAKIIVFSDIHGNLPALRAAFADISARPYDKIYCLGDLAAFGPWPDECISFIREEVKPDVTILGNTDRYLLELQGKKKLAARHDEAAQEALRWCADRVSADNIKWLKSLPAEHTETIADLKLRFVHGVPGDDESGITSGSSQKALAELFPQPGADITFGGHTHIACRRNVGRETLINTGSIGMPFDGDIRACYVRGQVADGQFHDFEYRRVPYSIDQTLDAIATTGLPDAERFSRRLRFALPA